jgi:hypothetical protein
MRGYPGTGNGAEWEEADPSGVERHLTGLEESTGVMAENEDMVRRLEVSMNLF